MKKYKQIASELRELIIKDTSDVYRYSVVELNKIINKYDPPEKPFPKHMIHIYSGSLFYFKKSRVGIVEKLMTRGS